MPKFAPIAFLVIANLALAQAQSDTLLQRTQALLEAVREEQRAVYQQFQMIHHCSRRNCKIPIPCTCRRDKLRTTTT